VKSLSLQQGRCSRNGFRYKPKANKNIPNYASWALSLYECTAADFSRKKTTWTNDYLALFHDFKKAVQASVTLHFPDYYLPRIIRSDSSDQAVKAILFQEEHGSSPDEIIHQPIAFASLKYFGAATNCAL
jgi:RNase H-like domain found in reverse transcriptase